MTFSAFRFSLLACFVQAGSVFFSSTVQAQNTSELGFGLGALNYRGEVSPQVQVQNSRPALNVFYRKDVSIPVTLRGGLMAGFLRADDGNVTGSTGTVPAVQGIRQTDMKGSLLEASAILEYNFRDYRNRNDHVHFTPYGFFGVAGYYSSTSTRTRNDGLRADFARSGSQFGIAVPVGAGLKYALSDYINLGFEVGARKIFTDRLDQLSDQTPLLVNPHDQDWYYHAGFSVSYTFYKVLCPENDNSNSRRTDKR